MQGLADGYFVIPTTIANYLAGEEPGTISTDMEEFKQAEASVKERIDQLININGTRTVDSFHKELGLLVWEQCGMGRSKEGLEEALRRIPEIRKAFWKNVRVPGDANGVNTELEKAGRVADFLEFAEVMCTDALNREESCGGHFRLEYQFTEDSKEVKEGKTQPGEALRRDKKYAYVAAWEFNGVGEPPVLHKEQLEFENVHLAIRSYA
jgi:succinate dehydrogenase / fumarate reductase flavoprotein subunit